MELTRHEAKVICFWLNTESNHKFYGGSYEDIEEIYNKLAEFSNHRGKWGWLKHDAVHAEEEQ